MLMLAMSGLLLFKSSLVFCVIVVGGWDVWWLQCGVDQWAAMVGGCHGKWCLHS